MFKALEFIFWVAILAVVLIVCLKFYEENYQFRNLVDAIWSDFSRFFREKLSL